MPTSMSPCFLLHAIAAATAMHFQVEKQACCCWVSDFLPRKGENIEISNLGAVETSVSRASAILGNFLTTRLNPSWPPLFYPAPLFSQLLLFANWDQLQSTKSETIFVIIVILLSNLSFSCLLLLLSTSRCSTRPACCPSPSRQPTPPGAITYHILT